MFLWIIVIAMAVALAAECLSLAGMGLIAVHVYRSARKFKYEFTREFQPSIEMAKDFARAHYSDYERVRHDGGEILRMLTVRFHAIRETWQDASVRAQRLRLRLHREGAPRMRQLRRDQQISAAALR